LIVYRLNITSNWGNSQI